MSKIDRNQIYIGDVLHVGDLEFNQSSDDICDKDLFCVNDIFVTDKLKFYRKIFYIPNLTLQRSVDLMYKSPNYTILDSNSGSLDSDELGSISNNIVVANSVNMDKYLQILGYDKKINLEDIPWLANRLFNANHLINEWPQNESYLLENEAHNYFNALLSSRKVTPIEFLESRIGDMMEIRKSKDFDYNLIKLWKKAQDMYPNHNYSPFRPHRDELAKARVKRFKTRNY